VIVPELPEVEALADVLRERAVGRVVTRVDVAAISALKTYDPPVTSLGGLTVTGVARHGKFLDLDVDGLHLVVHLARAGWLRWRDALPTAPPKPGGRSPLALRVHLDDGSGFDLTEAGTRKKLSVYVVRDPRLVPGVARLGPDPLDGAFSPQVLAGILGAHGRAQVKGVLRDQSVLAGIGNAYSDEILHVARLSPFKPASSFDAEAVRVLFDAIRSELTGALERSRGLAAGDLKAEKKAGLRVHGRTGLPCPVCGDTVREVSFADSSLQYCPTCQTGGRPLADRRMSRLLK
jgi:formamidopyrimidine-DNA glycosylase